MQVVKRDGQREAVMLDKITRRIAALIESRGCESGQGGVLNVDPVCVAIRVVEGIYDGVTTRDLDVLAAEIAATMTTTHPDYARLAARIAVSNLHKETPPLFSQVVQLMHDHGLVSRELFQIVEEHPEIDSWIVDDRDFDYDYFGFKTLERSYLMRLDGDRVIERPQFMLMRVALGIHGTDLDSARTTYNLMSQRYFTHATPTLFNAGTERPQMSSCFLLSMNDDSIDGIYKTLSDCAKISKFAGGIGVSIHNIRARGSFIHGTNGTSNGIVPMLRVFNSTARYVDQGGGKRKGSIAIYLEPWHADVLDFLDLKKNTGSEEHRARDLFYAMWIPDLFMKRVALNQQWSLMCPSVCKDLCDLWGDEFEEAFIEHERQGRVIKTIPAQQLWEKIITAQIETGTPYMMFKDHVNRKSNQKNLGTIRSSNLCTEIVEYTDKDEVAVCNLASLSLPMFVKNGVFDHELLSEVVHHATHNLNKVIDKNFYPIPEAKHSNMRHRPIGLGVQGLADVFAMMRLPFTSVKAKQLNRDIFETIYHAALTASCELAERDGPYSTFQGSPASHGLLQFDLWGDSGSDRFNWPSLKKRIMKHGLRNSLLVAPMPTASTAQLLGNNDAFEPFTSNLFVRRVLSGEFIVVNKHLMADLTSLGLWNEDMKEALMRDNGSVQNLPIPQELKDIYKTVWELKMKDIIDMSADRGRFIDQSQSLNLFVESPTINKISSMHMYAWSKGLKTGMYYLRTKSAVNAIKFTIKANKGDASSSKAEGPVCTKEEGCIMCSS